MTVDSQPIAATPTRTMDNDRLNTILRLADAGVLVATIAAAVALTPGRVYALLRVHRPDRQRTPRPCTSDKPRAIRGLAGEGIRPARIAALLGVRRQYVYRVLGEARA